MHAIPEQGPLELDPIRITGNASAIALNGVLLMLLLAPITAPHIGVPRREEPIVLIRQVPVPPPPPPPEPQPVEITAPAPTPPVAAPQPSVTQEQPEIVVDPLPGDTYVPPQPPVAETAPANGGPVDTAGPKEGARLEYASAPPPPYPREAVLDNLTGTVMLEVLVDVDGRPLEVTVKRSSGHRVLDAAARRQVLTKWRFRPAMDNGRAVQAIGVVPVDFKLD